MRALLMAIVFGAFTTSAALSEPLALVANARPAVEVAKPKLKRPPKPIRLAMPRRLPEPRDVITDPPKREQPSVMEKVRARVYEELPAVSRAIVTPLPIPTADGTLTGLGIIGRF